MCLHYEKISRVIIILLEINNKVPLKRQQPEMLYILNIIIFILASISAFGLAYFYASKKTTWFTIIVTFIGWLMGFLIIALLPLDIYVVSLIPLNLPHSLQTMLMDTSATYCLTSKLIGLSCIGQHISCAGLHFHFSAAIWITGISQSVTSSFMQWNTMSATTWSLQSLAYSYLALYLLPSCRFSSKLANGNLY